MAKWAEVCVGERAYNMLSARVRSAMMMMISMREETEREGEGNGWPDTLH